MPKATFNFPQGFLWGTATSSHQVEGNNSNNTWWAWEQQPGRILNGDKSGAACEWWSGRWKEDLDRAAEAGQKSHRLSLEWSRVQPTPDRWDEDAIDHYRAIVRGICERGMTPMITLHHFTDPLWLQERGGWENEAIVSLFGAYAKKVAEALHPYNQLWVTINEPALYVLFGYLIGEWPPGETAPLKLGRLVENMVRAHAAAYQALHAVQPEAQVGLAHHYRGTVAKNRWNPLDRVMAKLQFKILNNTFPYSLRDGVIALPFYHHKVPEAKGTQDFIGINYYTRDHVSFSLLNPKMVFSRQSFPEDADLSDEGFIANVPDGLLSSLKWAQKINVPIFVTENGVNDRTDHIRPRYMIQHVHAVWRGVNFGLPVKGYFWWSQVDNFEWERGWSQRFGLWELDIETQKRRKRPSADLYAEICRANALSSDMVQRYAPEIFARLFPG